MSLSILLIEDNATDANFLQANLSASGDIAWNITHVEQFNQGIVQLQNSNFDVVLLDLNLPDINGLDAVSHIHTVAPNLPIIVLTNIDSETLGIESLRRGAQDYLVKGQTNHNLLKRAIRYAIERSRTQRIMNQQITAMATCQEGIAILNRNEEYVYLNQAHASIFGYTSPVELIGKTWRVLYDEAIQNKLRQEVIPVLVEQGNWRGETIGKRRDGTTFHIEVSLTRLDDGGLVCTVVDITKRKQAEGALRENIERFRNCFELPLIGVAITAPDKKWIEVNDMTCTMLGYSRQELLHMTWEELTHPDDRRLDLEYFNQLLSGKIEQYAMDKRYIRKDGEVIYAYLGVGSVRKADGTLDYVVALMQDITRRKQVETELRQTKEFLEAIVENSPIAIIAKESENLKFTLWNPAATELLGFTAEEAIGKTDHDLFSEEYANCFNQSDFQVLSQGGILDIHREVVPIKDGNSKILHTRKTRLLEKGNTPKHLLVFTEDVTEKEQAHEALRQSEEKFRQLAENIQEVFFLYSADYQQTLYISPAYEEVWGHSRQDLYGNPYAWLEAVHPDDRERIFAKTERQTQLYEDFNEEYRIIRPDGTSRWIWARSKVIFKETGEPYRRVGIAEDITNRKQAEEEVLRALAREKELNELKSSFVSMVSHEFRTPLATILSSTELLQRYGSQCTLERRETLFERIIAGVQRMTQLLNDVLVIGKVEAGKLQFNPQQLDLIKFSHDLMEEVRNSVSTGHQIRFIPSENHCNVCLDAQLLHHILTNLISNAIKYSASNTTITVELVRQDKNIVFQVSDQGMGIPIEDQDKLFDIFHRGSNVGTISGTGLGLAIVKQCLDLHQGNIQVQSQLEKGSTFTVTIPLTRQTGL